MLGDAIAQFQQGSYEWFQIYTLGTTAEYAATLPRGTPVFIQGQLVGQTWVEPHAKPMIQVHVFTQDLTVLTTYQRASVASENDSTD